MRNDPMTKTYQTHDPDFTAASPRRSLLKNGKPRTKIRAPSLELRSLSLGSHHQFIFSELRTTISQGALCAFITRSRLRKNALLDLLAGRRIPDQGLCLLNGVKASDLPIEKKNRIGLLLREDRLYETMTVGQVAVFFSGCFSGWKNELYFRLISAIGATKKAKVSNLGFERRTVLALAVLLAGNPDMLILDEYFTELGGEMRDLFFREIKQFHARPGKTVIIVGHQPGLLPHLVDTLIFVGRSMLVHIATAELDGWSPSAGSRNMGDNRLGGQRRTPLTVVPFTPVQLPTAGPPTANDLRTATSHEAKVYRLHQGGTASFAPQTVPGGPASRASARPDAFSSADSEQAFAYIRKTG